MRFKLDENLRVELLDDLRAAGHEADGLRDEGLIGAPLAHEDHAVRACYAALRMQDAVKQYAEAVRRTEGVLVQVRVGLNAGEVVVR